MFENFLFGLCYNEKRIFDFYKKDLEKIGENVGYVRMNVIEYVCGFPKIDPYKMAAALFVDGIGVVFDDSSISQKENEKKRFNWVLL